MRDMRLIVASVGDLSVNSAAANLAFYPPCLPMSSSIVKMTNSSQCYVWLLPSVVNKIFYPQNIVSAGRNQGVCPAIGRAPRAVLANGRISGRLATSFPTLLPWFRPGFHTLRCVSLFLDSPYPYGSTNPFFTTIVSLASATHILFLIPPWLPPT